MKLTELTKDELCELVKRILKSSLSASAYSRTTQYNASGTVKAV